MPLCGIILIELLTFGIIAASPDSDSTPQPGRLKPMSLANITSRSLAEEQPLHPTDPLDPAPQEFDPEPESLLQEGETLNFFTANGYYSYHVFRTSDPDVEEIRIRLTTYGGNATMYASSQDAHPNKTHFQQQSNSMVDFRNTSVVHVAVYGNEWTNYGLLTTARRKGALDKGHVIQLANGVLQEITQDAQFEFFKIDLGKNSGQNLTILLVPKHGDLTMYVKSGSSNSVEIPDSNSCQWSSKSKIDITKADKYYSTVYWVGVQKFWNRTAVYTIQYVLSGDVPTYRVGEQIIGVTEPKKIQYYRVPRLSKSLVITKDLYSKNNVQALAMYISLNDSNPHPTASNANFIIHGKTATISQYDMGCPYEANRIGPCYVYIGVESKETVFYTISTKFDNTHVKLIDGLPQTYPLEDTTFIYELNNKEVSVQIYSAEGSMTVVDCWTGTEEFKASIFANNLNSNFFKNIVIPPQENSSTLYVRVQPGISYIKNSTFTIGAYSEVTLLTEADPVTAKLKSGQISYFRVTVFNVESLLISCTTAGNVYMYAAKGISSRPDSLNFDREFEFVDNHHLLLDQSRNQGNLVTGDYIIGVLAYEETELRIAYTSGKYKFFNVYIAQPFNVLLQADEPYYYHLWNNNAVKIIVINLGGNVQVSVKSHQDDYAQAIQSKDSLVSRHVDKQEVIYLPRCEDCLYLIELISYEKDSQIVLQVADQTPGHYIELYNSVSWRDVVEEDQAIYYMLGSYGQQQLQIQLLTGEIRVLTKQSSAIKHDDEADQNVRVKSDMQIDLPRANSTYFYYYLKVIGIAKESVYNIVPVNKDSDFIIHLGQLRSGVLSKLQSATYVYSSFMKEEDRYVLFQLVAKNSTISDLNITIAHTSMYDPVMQSTYFVRAAIFKVLDQKGRYTFKVTQEGEDYVHYHLTLIDDNTNVLVDDVPFYNFGMKGSSQIYEVFIEEDSQLFVEAYTCSGAILVQGTKNASNIQENLFEIQLSQSSQTHISHSLVVSPGIYYFVVQIVSSKGGEGSTYYIKQQTFERMEFVPYKNFEVRSQLSYSLVDENLTVQLPPVKSLNSQIAPTEVKYILKLDESLEELTLQCLFDDHFVGTNDSDHYPYVYAISLTPLDSNGKSFQLNLVDERLIFLSGVVKVKLEYNGEPEELTYPLETIRLSDRMKQNSESEWRKGLVLCAFTVLLVLFSVYVYRKTKGPRAAQPQAQAQIELNYQTFA